MNHFTASANFLDQADLPEAVLSVERTKASPNSSRMGNTIAVDFALSAGEFSRALVR
jgi:hypothetical protein